MIELKEREPFNTEINELIFARKNKAYGAYQLRRYYSVTLSMSMWFVIIVFILVSSGPLVYNLLSADKEVFVMRPKVVQVLQLSEPPSIDARKQTAPLEAPVSESTNKQFLSPEVKSDAEVASEFYWNVDTVSLQNIYTENTLDVQIKYPYGWTFIDQNIKKRLDGVTFWGSTNLYNPPPYVHLEVKDRDLFNPSRYKYNREYENYTIYYNDPQEMSDQYTRIIYIRTETDVDYTLKLIMKGKENFESFEPVFFGMLQSFTFGE